MIAKFGIERELENKLCITEYENGNGDFHFHSQIEICIVNEGEIEALINNNKRCLKKGELSIALSYDTHVYLPVVYSKFTVLIIPVNLCEEFTDYVKPQKITNPFISNPDVTEKINSYMNEIKKDKTILSKLGHVYLILDLIAENVSFEENHIYADTDLSSKLLLYIHSNFTNDISLSSISEYFGYNPCYISQFFKSCFNIGINRYITILKLNNAILLLKENKHTTTFCAMESGFHSLRTFYRAFNIEFGCSPQEYLKLIKVP